MTVSLPAPPVTPISWRMPGVFMLRTAGLPIEVADRLAFDRTADWARRVLDLEDQLRSTGRDLADALQVAVGRNLADDGLRQRLIKLRRDVFNLRPPRPADPAAWPAEALGADTHRELARWLETFEAYRRELAAGPTVLDDELAGRRAVLRGLADDPVLRGGILLASPSLDRYLAGYLTGTGPLGKRARRVERSLLEYAYRTAAKTSPFSRLTTVNVGTFGGGTGRLLDAAVDAGGTVAAMRGSARLNLAALGRLSAIVLADETLRPDLPVTLTTGWRIAHGRLRYLRRRRTSSEDGDAAITLESIHESLFVLPTGRVLHDILAALDGGRVRRMADLVTELTTDGRPADEIALYLHHLLRVGLLVVPNLQLDIHADDPVQGYRSALRQIGRDWSDRLAERVAAPTGWPPTTRRRTYRVAAGRWTESVTNSSRPTPTSAVPTYPPRAPWSTRTPRGTPPPR
ncbi:hypothetical protein GCM10027614_01030 [Micromonospora vulcania]